MFIILRRREGVFNSKNGKKKVSKYKCISLNITSFIELVETIVYYDMVLIKLNFIKSITLFLLFIQGVKLFLECKCDHLSYLEKVNENKNPFAI